ncbi:hypothetical protein K491DRAFT_685712 [Lophiostoma macrostomum CBS 122681]|uniref:Uncharacterized protein n=1 Tax=Lophiostoma macrostomum CBS 122681 TaxID=1314788 RepID=A0A6A6SKR7_9PLEO|nr:hypothetical protein K491DRAFT_685712 [Lophiostoma macrostomum CBS 122681]
MGPRLPEPYACSFLLPSMPFPRLSLFPDSAVAAFRYSGPTPVVLVMFALSLLQVEGIARGLRFAYPRFRRRWDSGWWKPVVGYSYPLPETLGQDTEIHVVLARLRILAMDLDRKDDAVDKEITLEYKTIRADISELIYGILPNVRQVSMQKAKDQMVSDLSYLVSLETEFLQRFWARPRHASATVRIWAEADRAKRPILGAPVVAEIHAFDSVSAFLGVQAPRGE